MNFQNNDYWPVFVTGFSTKMFLSAANYKTYSIIQKYFVNFTQKTIKNLRKERIELDFFS
jgi:hypothetical protein